MNNTLTKDEIVRDFQGCIHCSQVVMSQWAEEIGLDHDTALRMVGPLGGGCFNGDVCGCVSSALCVLGARYGHCMLDDFDGNNRMISVIKEFREKFIERHGSIVCRDLTGKDFSKPGELESAFEDGSLFECCPEYVKTTLEILDELM